MKTREFTVVIDGIRVVVDQAEQSVSILDGGGNVSFRERIQVAAASKGLFSSVEDAVKLPNGVRQA